MLSATLFLSACGNEPQDPAPPRPSLSAESAPPAERPARPVVTAPLARPTPGTYAVAEEVIRRQTYLQNAVLLPLGPGREEVATLFRESGIRFARLASPETFGQYACGDVTEDGARSRTAFAARELSRHSPELLHRSGVDWVVLCSHLTQRGRPRNAVPASTAATLLLDATGFGTDEYFRQTLHHELFHMINAANQGLLREREWLAQNPEGSPMGRGGATARDSAGALGSGAPGFVSEYAQSAVEEDQAEVFRFLATSPEALSALAARDPGVAGKRELMLGGLARFCDGHAERLICREL